MNEAIQFYAPDWELVLLWCVIAAPTCLAVLWLSKTFGRSGALLSTGAFILARLALPIGLRALGPGVHLLWVLVFTPPLLVGALVGFAIWLLRYG
jgi:hypothetical protein